MQFDYAYTISAWRIRKQIMKSTVLLHLVNTVKQALAMWPVLPPLHAGNSVP
jgi:hypothetical protein